MFFVVKIHINAIFQIYQSLIIYILLDVVLMLDVGAPEM